MVIVVDLSLLLGYSNGQMLQRLLRRRDAALQPTDRQAKIPQFPHGQSSSDYPVLPEGGAGVCATGLAPAQAAL